MLRPTLSFSFLRPVPRFIVRARTTSDGQSFSVLFTTLCRPITFTIRPWKRPRHRVEVTLKRQRDKGGRLTERRNSHPRAEGCGGNLIVKNNGQVLLYLIFYLAIRISLQKNIRNERNNTLTRTSLTGTMRRKADKQRVARWHSRW